MWMVPKLIELQKKYFLKNKAKQALFDVFNLKVWKKRMPLNEPKDVKKLAEILHVPNSDKLLQDWPLFRKQIIDSNVICNSESPELIWTSILNSGTFQKTLEISQLLRTILVIPTGNSLHSSFLT